MLLACESKLLLTFYNDIFISELLLLYLQIISIYNNLYFYILYLFSIYEIRHQCLMQIKQKFKLFFCILFNFILSLGYLIFSILIFIKTNYI